MKRLVLLVLLCVSATAAAADVASVAQQVRAATLSTHTAIHDLHVAVGPAQFEFTDGTLYRTAGEGAAEMVFIGRGHVRLDPNDAIESQQLELFTGHKTLDVPFTEVVIAAGRKAAAPFAAAATAAHPDATPSAQANNVLDEWRKSSTRRLLAVEPVLIADAVGDPLSDAFFLAEVHGSYLGKFVYVVDPRAEEQVTLGQFVPAAKTTGEQRAARRQVRREQRHGRMIGLEAEDIGVFDNWVSCSLRDAAGKPIGGNDGIDPVRYTIDATLGADTRLTAKEHLQLRNSVEGLRALSLQAGSDLDITRVHDAKKALFFTRSGKTVGVLFDEPLHAGDTIELDVEYAGNVFDQTGPTYTLRDTTNWYPRTDSDDRAAYDVTFHWPKGLDLIAGGKHAGGGEDGGGLWEHRVLDMPTAAFTFEIGNFRTETVDAGHVKITVAFDPSVDLSKMTTTLRNDTWRNNSLLVVHKGLSPAAREEIKTTARDSLLFYEQLYGKYPLDELTVLNVTRDYSQAMLGFVTLSTSMMADNAPGLEGAIDAGTDRRVVIAHEIAHQWWGHIMGWRSYRDQWLSESLASYSAMQFSRQKLDWHGRLQNGLTTGWQRMLLRATPSGRRIESVGPVTLGQRLDSSRADAYQPIVYLKGTIVLDMLARYVGEQNFLHALQSLVASAAATLISTEDVLHRVALVSGVSIDDFARRFVYGTGIATVYYDGTSSRQPDGKWKLHLTAKPDTPYFVRYRVVRDHAGLLDVLPERVEQPSSSAPVTVRVPLRVGVTAPGTTTMTYASTYVPLQSWATDQQLDVEWEPKEVWLDRDRESLAVFISESRNEKRAAITRAESLIASGKFDDAESTLHVAIYAPPTEDLGDLELGFDLGPGIRKDVQKFVNEMLDADAYVELARIHAFRRDAAGAQDALDKARKSAGSHRLNAIKEETTLIDARIAILRGDYDGAVKRLSKALLDERSIDSGEAYALLAIAAQQGGGPDTVTTAMAEAQKRGVDVSAMKTP
jgi:hypothetical protein